MPSALDVFVQNNRNAEGGIDESSLNQAKIYHGKLLKQYQRQEYFEVLTYSQKCSQLFRQRKLVDLYSQDTRGFLILLDCFKYSSIAYLQLQQHEQAVVLSSDIIDCLKDKMPFRDEYMEQKKYSLIQALLIRARANELIGKFDTASEDLHDALEIDPKNHNVAKLVDRLKSKQLESLSKKSTRSSQLSHSEKLTLHSAAANYQDDLRQSFGRNFTFDADQRTSLHPRSPSLIRMDHSLSNLDDMFLEHRPRAPENKFKILLLQLLQLFRDNRSVQIIVFFFVAIYSVFVYQMIRLFKLYKSSTRENQKCYSRVAQVLFDLSTYDIKSYFIKKS